MPSSNWFSLFIVALIVGLAGYLVTLSNWPTLLPPAFRLGGLHEPTTVLFLGTDVVYTELGNRKKKIDAEAFNGRSDTIMVVRLDPFRNSLSVLSIPRDTEVYVPGSGLQKINSANAIGGHNLAMSTVTNFLQIPVDHYVVLNVHGLVELVDELGGVTIEIPKRMRYLDWTAKLKIDLEPGFHTLTGNQAMGFVRFRHDALGDIGRVQRQEIFLRAVMDQARKPSSWAHLPKLIEIASKYIDTDLSVPQMMGIATFVRGVPKSNQTLAMMPGSFGGNGNWAVAGSDVRKMVAKLQGLQFVSADRKDIRIAVENASSSPKLGAALCRFLRSKGYLVNLKHAERNSSGHSLVHSQTRIIAEKGNPEDAEQVKLDLGCKGDVISASVGDIESSVTIVAGNDLQRLAQIGR